jgi:hypothetical protein
MKAAAHDRTAQAEIDVCGNEIGGRVGDPDVAGQGKTEPSARGPSVDSSMMCCTRRP